MSTSHHSLLMAQQDWGQALEAGSVCVLDEGRGILACRVTMSGKVRQVLQQGPLRMILTAEIIEKLALWNAQQQQGETHAE